MKKKVIPFLLSLILAAIFILPAAGENILDVEESMAFFSGVRNHMAFALPGHASVIQENDYPGVWTDSVQLFGNCAGDGAEFQLRFGNIEDLINQIAAQHPGEDPRDISLNALINYGLFYPNTFGAKTGKITPFADADTGCIGATIPFTYPDTPGETYRCVCFLADNLAACLVIQDCDHTQAVLDSMHFVSPEEEEKILAEKGTAVTMSVDDLSVVWPGPYITVMEEDRLITACFGADFSFMQIDLIPKAWDTTGDEKAQMDFMLAMAEKMSIPFDSGDILEAELKRPNENTLRLDFKVQDKSVMGEYGPMFLCRSYAGPTGTYYIYAPDNDTGRRFMDSVTLAGEAGPAQAPDQTSGIKESAVLDGFRSGLSALMDRGAQGFPLRPGNFTWSDPILSGGCWSRAVYSADLKAGIRLFLDGTGPDAAIREIRILRWADTDTDLEGFNTLAHLCALAFRGDETFTMEHLDPENTSLVYDRAVITPVEAVPAADPLSFPEGTIPPITRLDLKASDFAARCAALTPVMSGLEFSYVTSQTDQDGDEMRAYSLGSTLIIAYLEGTGDDAPIRLAAVIGLAEESAPEVVAGTMLCYAAITGMTADMTPALSWTLLESPLWSDLCDLWPLLCNGDVCAHLQEDNGMPQGFVSGMPE